MTSGPTPPAMLDRLRAVGRHRRDVEIAGEQRRHPVQHAAVVVDQQHFRLGDALGSRQSWQGLHNRPHPTSLDANHRCTTICALNLAGRSGLDRIRTRGLFLA